MTFFEEKVRFAAEKYKMFSGVKTVFAGLSGGADSVSLLLALLTLKSEYGFTLSAVHVDHNIRGEESKRDRIFCEELCRKLGVPLKVHSVDAVSYSKEHRLSLEEGARELRYEIFSALPDNCRAATAHTLSDSAETVIFNLSRGTGIKGLMGIPPVRDKIIRPLILCTREEVEEYLSLKNQPFVTDSTNLSDDYSRNKIRHNIIPLMKELNSGFFENIKNMTENLSEENSFLEETARKSADHDLRTLPAAVKKRVIINKLRENNIEINSQRINTLCALSESGGKLDLSGDVYAVIRDGKISVKKISAGKTVFEETAVKLGENPFLCDKTVIIEVLPRENCGADGIVNSLFTKEVLDYDKIQGDVVLRNRRDGDKYIRANRNFTSSLKKLMNESVPADERDLIPVLADRDGIIWTEVFGTADRVKVTENTKNIMIIKVK